MRERHGKRYTSLYNSWCAIKARCYNPNNKSYARYGGRGITMYEAWRNSFQTFYNYVGERPSAEHSIDRIDNSGNYEPGNVRWATPYEQAANKRNTAKDIGVRKINRPNLKRPWQARLYAKNKVIFSEFFSTKEEAIVARAEAEIKYL